MIAPTWFCAVLDYIRMRQYKLANITLLITHNQYQFETWHHYTILNILGRLKSAQSFGGRI